MFLIKNSQLETLSAIGREEFIKKMMKLLRDNFVDVRSIPMHVLHDKISVQIENAKGYGLTLTQTFASYIVTAFVLGENFDKDVPKAHEILTNDTTESTKTKSLEDLVNTILAESEKE
jgi:hypothetical protein